MSSVKRLFVEKRPGFDVEARHMLADLRENLGIAALEAVRVVNRYDLEGVDEADFDRASRTILSEPNVDTVSAALCRARLASFRDGISPRPIRPARGFRGAVHRPAYPGGAAKRSLRARDCAQGGFDGQAV